jgi:hypothetical protein
MSTQKLRKFPETSADIDADTPYPSTSTVYRCLKALRRHPLDEERVRQRVELLCVPFIRSLDQRAAHFVQGARLITQSFAPIEQIVLDCVLFQPSTEGVGKRRDEALEGLIGKGHLKPTASTRAITHIEDKALQRLAEILASEAFTQTYADSAEITSRRHRATVASLSGLVKRNYCWSLEFDPEDTRRQIGHKAVTVEAISEPQCVLLDRFYTTGSEPKPESLNPLSETEKHEWLATRPEDRPDRPPTSWWYHILNLGLLLEAGETRTLRWREAFWDEGRRFKPHLAMIVTPGMENLSLALRLPTQHRTLPAEARITVDPLGARKVEADWKCSPNDSGWCIERFTDLKPGVEYGIYFTNLRLYS